jgi:hypothetical protein
MRLVIALVLLLVAPAVSATVVQVDDNYCHGLALMNKATTEAHMRREPLEAWKADLLSQRDQLVKDKTGVLYIVLPEVIRDADKVYKDSSPPVDQYINSYNHCMKYDFGGIVAVNE